MHGLPKEAHQSAEHADSGVRCSALMSRWKVQRRWVWTELHKLLSLLALVILPVFLTAGRAAADRALELSAGSSTLLMLSPVSGTLSTSVDAAAHGEIARSIWWSGGARLGLTPVSPEAFARISVRPRVGSYIPSVGFELGVTGRGKAGSDDALLSELRKASEEGLWPVYVAIHAAPLCFVVRERFRIAALELQLGTHLSPLGRYVRAQLGIVSVGFAL